MAKRDDDRTRQWFVSVRRGDWFVVVHAVGTDKETVMANVQNLFDFLPLDGFEVTDASPEAW